ncbi:MAG TPA: FecR domain-containing protein [Pyrinomonadaceae bacterium]|nr:FecR domain-containing protein [Pyrinomonadaceae bacterium]
MENNKYRKFYVEWWNIRRSTIYGAMAIILLAATLVFGGWWASKNNWFAAGEAETYPMDSAKIISFEGEVRITRAATRETILVTKQTYVAAGDTVQTQADGRAIIQMIDGSVYSVRPNSTVVVRDTTSLFGGKNVRVRLNDGQLNVRTDEQPDNVKNIVEVAESENQLGPQTDASFDTDGENGGEIRVSRGGVETTLGGETSKIGPDQYAAVNNGQLSAREKILAPPVPVAPGNSSQLIDAGGGVSVGFNWQPPDQPVQSYYLQVAKSPWFSPDAILVDRTGLGSNDFHLTGLTPGTYYWRVRALSRSGQTTNWNDAWKFTVVRRESNIRIELTDLKVESVGGGIFIITGKTQPGMAVRSQGRDTFAVSDGSFRLQVSSQSAETSIEIGDDRGNRAGFVVSLRTGRLMKRY